MELTIDQALQQGVAAQKKGKLKEAARLYRTILQSQPAHPDANHNLGVLAVLVNKTDAALPLFKTAVEVNPKAEQFWLSYIDALIKEKQFDNVKKVLEQAMKQDVDEEKLNTIKIQLASMNETVNADSENPPQELLNSLLGHYQNGRFNDAEKLAASITKEFPKHPFGWKVLGVVLKQTGRVVDSLTAMQKCVQLAPQDAEAHSNLGNTLQDLGRFDEALGSCRQAIALKPNYAEAQTNLGVTLLALGRLDEALVSFTQAVALKPDFAEAQLNLCELLEKMNRTDEILPIICRASEHFIKHTADFLYFEALIEFRKENYNTAAELVKKININELLEKRQPAALKLQGDLHHYEKDYGAAFEAYKLKNKHVKDSLAYKRQEPEKYFIQLREKVSEIEQLQDQSAYKSEVKPSWIQPTFLIGFPRSGTTLLDTILRTHSNIDVLEELPMVDKMHASFGETPSISEIEAMDNVSAEIVSGFYLRELNKHLEVSKKRTLVDKLPLNVLQLPLINQVFPKARYIIALRHPLDCVLSCWMQNFKLNSAMANMVDLKRIVEFYDTAMSILKLSEERYSLETHRIRYEDLILDFEENVTHLLTFLDLKWEEELRDYQKTALAREIIDTPSRTQVIKPLYQTASYRWKNYEKYIEPYKSRLAPWIKEYGYSN
tara:strand:+ start:82 stop:2070 length:1989 start_codon:yes stop_codon:yes gene_type:complete